MNTQITTEVCVESWSGALAAFEAGAHRIELCQALAVGGLTPGPGLLDCISEVPGEVVVLIRPRAGDFHYDRLERRTLLQDVRAAVAAGAAGVAVGALQASGEVDFELLSEIRETCEGIDLCFHRAFDGVPDPIRTVGELAEAGVVRVLTSGQAQDVVGGTPVLRDLVRVAPGGIAVLAGGGIRTENIGQLIENTGVHQVHFSARRPLASKMQHHNVECDLHHPDHYERLETSAEEIRRYLDAIESRRPN